MQLVLRQLQKEWFRHLESWGRDPVGSVVFPKARGLHMDRMPFIAGDVNSLPESCQQYWPIIEQCLATTEEMCQGCVVYLTVHEGAWMDSGGAANIAAPSNTMRRSHSVHAGNEFVDDGLFGPIYKNENTGEETDKSGQMQYGNGVFSACSRDRKVWNMCIDRWWELIGVTGHCDHLLEIMDAQHSDHVLYPNQLVWMHDNTPHELPLLTSHDQYFELVTTSLLWYQHRFTANPLNVKPNPAVTVVLSRDATDAELGRVRELMDNLEAEEEEVKTTPFHLRGVPPPLPATLICPIFGQTPPAVVQSLDEYGMRTQVVVPMGY